MAIDIYGKVIDRCKLYKGESMDDFISGQSTQRRAGAFYGIL